MFDNLASGMCEIVPYDCRSPLVAGETGFFTYMCMLSNCPRPLQVALLVPPEIRWLIYRHHCCTNDSAAPLESFVKSLCQDYACDYAHLTRTIMMSMVRWGINMINSLRPSSLLLKFHGKCKESITWSEYRNCDRGKIMAGLFELVHPSMQVVHLATR